MLFRSGGKIWCSPWCNVGHTGSYTFTGSYSKAYENKKKFMSKDGPTGPIGKFEPEKELQPADFKKVIYSKRRKK